MKTIEINKIYNMECIEFMKTVDDEFIDLVLTSPPYDNLRSYAGKSIFQFESTAKELSRIIKPCGVIVWIVGDQTINGSETGASFRQALDPFLGSGTTALMAKENGRNFIGTEINQDYFKIAERRITQANRKLFL